MLTQNLVTQILKLVYLHILISNCVTYEVI
jgi:hypothetical protein